MKIFISADIEGVTAINNWDETSHGKHEYAYFREQMNREVLAACEGALAGGATEIVVRDAHNSTKNIDADRLPRQATLIRGWSGHPYSMVQGIDRSFAAVLMVGYHTRAGCQGNPLAHTMSPGYSEVRINGRPVSEFFLNALTCELEGVPTVFVSGDKSLCEEATSWQKKLTTVATTMHFGQTTQTLGHPEVLCEKIRAGVKSALHSDLLKQCHIPLPKEFTLEITYKEPHKAYRASFYPRARLLDDCTVQFQSPEYLEIIRAVQFI